jgi:hypothetical protein
MFSYKCSAANDRFAPQAAIGPLRKRLIAGAKGHIFRDAGSLEVAEVFMARLTAFLARLIGLFTILLVPTLLVHGSAIIENTAADKPVMLTYGIISLAIGVAMILGHNIWSGGALPVVVTLVGWLILAKGLLILLIEPETISRSSSCGMANITIFT